MPGIFIVLWNVFVTNRTAPGVLVLGLEESSLPPCALEARSHITIWRLLLYLLTGVVTFWLGVLSFDAVQSLS